MTAKNSAASRIGVLNTNFLKNPIGSLIFIFPGLTSAFRLNGILMNGRKIKKRKKINTTIAAITRENTTQVLVYIAHHPASALWQVHHLESEIYSPEQPLQLIL